MSQSPPDLPDDAFDNAMIAACLRTAAAVGWSGLRIAAAARGAGLPLARARLRFPSRGALLVRLGRLADTAALAEASRDGSARDRLFAMLMRRLDIFQAHRDGVLALLSSLPFRPQTTILLGTLTLRSMRWMLDAADIDTTGLVGRLRVKGLTAVWLWTLRAWQRDETTDLATTMAALDQALARAERYAGWLPGSPRSTAPTEEPSAETEEGSVPEAHGDDPYAPPDADSPSPA